MAFFRRKTTEQEFYEELAENSATYFDPSRQIRPGVEFPPKAHRNRLARYRVFKKVYENEGSKKSEVFSRAEKLMRNTEHAPQLETLKIAVNLADIIVTKPADMLVGVPPQYESGLEDSSDQQIAINNFVEENDLNQTIYESAIGTGIRGDGFIQTRYGTRQDFSALAELGLSAPEVELEPIIEHVAADIAFPETADGSVKKFRAIDIAQVEYVETHRTATPFLNVTRHVPGYIIYERYRLSEFEGGVDSDNDFNYPIQTWKIEELIGEREVVSTGVPHLLVQHIAYKSADYDWQGTSGLKSIFPLLLAIHDRLTQIDYILLKHSDPAMYGPEIDGVKGGGYYIPLAEGDVTPGYLTWNSQLDGAFRELETLISLVFQLAETPQWLFGTVLGSDNAGGTGTSHTDGVAIKARFMPILSKVARIRQQYDRAIRDALWYAQLLEVAQSEHANYEPVYPTIRWSDGLPRNEKEEAEIAEIRLASGVLDKHSAIKRLDLVDDEKAQETLRRIKDEEAAQQTVDASIFNTETED